jgi:hypothetical protein
MQHIPAEIVCLGIIRSLPDEVAVMSGYIGFFRKGVNTQRISPSAVDGVPPLGAVAGNAGRLALPAARSPKTAIFAEIVPRSRRSGMVSTASRQLTPLDWRIHDTATAPARLPAAAARRASAE